MLYFFNSALLRRLARVIIKRPIKSDKSMKKIRQINAIHHGFSANTATRLEFPLIPEGTRGVACGSLRYAIKYLNYRLNISNMNLMNIRSAFVMIGC